MPCSILLVEDDEAIRDAVQAILESENFAVFSAIDGRDALNKLKKPPKPCLILLDLMMPNLNGWQFIEESAGDSNIRDIPIVVMSAAGFFEQKHPDPRIKRMIKKPIDLDLLLGIIREICPAQATQSP